MSIKDLERVKEAVVRRYTITSGLALEGLKIEFSKNVDTAAVVGIRNEQGIIEVKKLEVNEEFFDSLSFSERVFVLAHESLHIALKHFRRAADKPERDIERKYKEYCMHEQDEEKRKIMKLKLIKHYHQIWNIATDACINAFLKKDGFKFPENVIDKKTGRKMQFVDMADGAIRSAEKIYDYLVQKEEQEGLQEKHQEKSNDNERKTADGGEEKTNPNIDDVDIDNYRGFDSHEEWTGDDQITDEKQQPQSENVDEKQDNDEIEEDEETILNKELENRRKSKSSPSSKKLFSSLRTVEGLADYVPTKPVVSWKRMLIGKLEKTTERWGNRRSSRYNPNARIEERVEEGQPKVEVILDVSVSVSKQLLKGFLMQLYHILESLKEDDNEEISFKVGTFSTNFSSFTYIRSKKDIKEYEPQIGGGTDFEVAATSFSENPGKTITKIVFTDGCLGSSQKTRVDDIIWIVFGDKMDFTPLGGRIIKVSDKEYQEIMNTKMYSEDEDNIGRRR